MAESYTIHQPVGDNISTYDVITLQEQVRRPLQSLLDKPHLDSFFIEHEGDAVEIGLSLTAGIENWVVHGLNRDWRGWYVTDLQGPSVIYSVPTTTADKASLLSLACTASVTATIVVF